MPELQLPDLIDEATCPLPGYEQLKFQVLLNPTQDTWRDWQDGLQMGDEEQRQKFGRALSTFFRETKLPGFDFSTPEMALQTIEQPGIRDELIWWLLGLPDTIVQHRRNLIAERLPKSWASASATPST